jgi:hypothetical protein
MQRYQRRSKELAHTRALQTQTGAHSQRQRNSARQEGRGQQSCFQQFLKNWTRGRTWGLANLMAAAPASEHPPGVSKGGPQPCRTTKAGSLKHTQSGDVEICQQSTRKPKEPGTSPQVQRWQNTHTLGRPISVEPQRQLVFQSRTDGQEAAVRWRRCSAGSIAVQKSTWTNFSSWTQKCKRKGADQNTPELRTS